MPVMMEYMYQIYIVAVRFCGKIKKYLLNFSVDCDGCEFYPHYDFVVKFHLKIWPLY